MPNYCRNLIRVIAGDFQYFLDECAPSDLDICTVGQLRLFLAIEGLDEIAKQFKS